MPAVKKKYTKEHVVLMILLYDLKQILTIGDIKRLFGTVIKDGTVDSKLLAEVYQMFIDLKVEGANEFEDYLVEGMDEWEALEETLNNNDELLQDDEVSGTFILAIASLAKENDISNRKINKLVKSLEDNSNYWNYIKEDSMELYQARLNLLKDL